MPWQSPAVQFDFVDTYINMEHVGYTMLIGAKQWRSAVLEIATVPLCGRHLAMTCVVIGAVVNYSFSVQ